MGRPHIILGGRRPGGVPLEWSSTRAAHAGHRAESGKKQASALTNRDRRRLGHEEPVAGQTGAASNEETCRVPNTLSQVLAPFLETSVMTSLTMCRIPVAALLSLVALVLMLSPGT